MFNIFVNFIRCKEGRPHFGKPIIRFFCQFPCLLGHPIYNDVFMKNFESYRLFTYSVYETQDEPSFDELRVKDFNIIFK